VVGEPFDAATPERLYPGGMGENLKGFEAALDAAIAAGFLVPDDKLETLEFAALSSSGKTELSKARGRSPPWDGPQTEAPSWQHVPSSVLP
jgi:hypothetical protein